MASTGEKAYFFSMTTTAVATVATTIRFQSGSRFQAVKNKHGTLTATVAVAAHNNNRTTNFAGRIFVYRKRAVAEGEGRG